ncbi:MAG: hypothetical protein HY710_10165 [Candidatus Latescibacteria bacterium]|nr:hypothetical protein [Candidatus Latescibacterota bacterium]
MTLVTLARFGTEAAGVPFSVTRFISATVVILAVPFYLGLKAARGALSGYAELALASFLFAFWGEITVAIATAATGLLGVQTHYLSPEEMTSTAMIWRHAGTHLIVGVVFGVYAILVSAVVYKVAKRGAAQPAAS